MSAQPHTRRSFLLGTGAGLAVGAPLGWLGWRMLKPEKDTPPKAVATTPAPSGMPGPYPGEVVEVSHPHSVNRSHRIDREAVRGMIERGMCELTGADVQYPDEAWKRFFQPGDVVGIKVNPVGRSRSGEVGSISNPEVILEIVRGLKSAGIPTRDMIMFDRYADDFLPCGYDALTRTRELDGIRWLVCSAAYTGTQVAIDGIDRPDAISPDLARHVAGYDPDSYFELGFASNEHDPKDDRRFRSHLSVIATRLTNKIINVPVLKDHRSAGVTLALKNLSHGLNNNVARSHLSGIGYGTFGPGQVSGPNQCNVFIPTGASRPALREKVVLHLLDGLIGVYEGGPGSWNRTWGTWRRQSLFFATDPVALDHVGWTIIDAKRREEGWPVVAEMGLMQYSPERQVAMALSRLMAHGAPDALTLTATDAIRRAGGSSEVFDRRQPEHIILAGTIGLGEFDARKIRHRRYTI